MLLPNLRTSFVGPAQRLRVRVDCQRLLPLHLSATEKNPGEKNPGWGGVALLATDVRMTTSGAPHDPGTSSSSSSFRRSRFASSSSIKPCNGTHGRFPRPWCR